MTLVEELELAARDCDIIADYFASPMAGARTRGAAEMHARAARLRARAERVRKLANWAEAGLNPDDLYRALAGPLPPPGTPDGT